MGVALEALLRECIVRVDSTVSGTGFFVAPGWILTCAHVVDGIELGQPVQVTWQHQLYQTTLLARAGPTLREPQGPDLALLTVERLDHRCVLLAPDLKLGDTLYSYGYSYVPDWSAPAQGDPVLLHYVGGTDDGRLLKMGEEQVEHGMSGAPLLNLRNGVVCGVVKSTRDDRQALGGRAVPIQEVLEAFPGLMVAQREYHDQHEHWRAAQEGDSVINDRGSINTQPLFSMGNPSWINAGIQAMASHLQEWKVVHTTVQDLYMTTRLVEKTVLVAEQDPSEVMIYNLEHIWFSTCEPKASKIAKEFQLLTRVRNRSMSELLFMLNGTDSVPARIRELRTGDRSRVARLRGTVYQLISMLEELLKVADLNIIEIATSIGT